MPGGARQAGPAGFRGDAGRLHEALPEPGGQGGQGGVCDAARRFRGAAVVQLGGEGRRAEMRQPVDAQRELVARRVQRPGAPGGEAQDGRAAQAGVGEEQGAAFAQARAGEREFRVRDGDARQFAPPRGGEAKREERGHRGFEGVAEGERQAAVRGGAAAAGGQHEPFAVEAFSPGQREGEAARRPAREGRDFAAGPQGHAGGAGGARQTFEDGARGIAGREHAPIGLDFEFHAAAFKPGAGVPGLEAGEGAAQGGAPARVMAAEVPGFEAGVGDIAASAAGDSHFGEEERAFFEHGDPGSGGRFRAGDGGEAAGGAAARDNDVRGVHSGSARTV